MPITLRKFNAQVKDPETGEMVPAGLLSSDSIEAIEAAGTAAVAAVEGKQAAAEAAIELKGETTLASIPVDYTELNNEVDDVKESLKFADNNILPAALNNAPVPATWENGKISTSSGNDSGGASDSRRTVGYYPTFGLNVIVGSNASIIVDCMEYDENYAYLGYTQIAANKYKLLPKYNTCKYIRIFGTSSTVEQSDIDEHMIFAWCNQYSFDNSIKGFVPGYINVGGSNVSVDNIVSSDTTKCVVVNCKKDDLFTINGTAGGNLSRVWTFVASDGTKLDGASGATTETNLLVKAPTNAAYLVINDNSDATSYYGISDSWILENIGEINDGINVLNTKLFTEISITGWTSDKYIPTNIDPVDITDKKTSSSGYKCSVIPCEYGDVFAITGKGATSARLWTFVDATGNKLLGSTREDEKTNYIVHAPVNSAYLIINTVPAGHVEKLSFENRIERLENENETKHHFNILIFGNSYAADCWGYVPFILMKYGITVNIYMYFRGSGSIRKLVEEWESTTLTGQDIYGNSHSRTLYHVDTRYSDKWEQLNKSSDSRYSAKEILEFANDPNRTDIGHWDIITLQGVSSEQYSDGEGGWTRAPGLEPWFRQAINLIYASYSKSTFDLGFFGTYNRCVSAGGVPVSAMDDRVETLQSDEAVYTMEPFDFVIPAGAAVFSARTNSDLCSTDVADVGNLFAPDKIHLQEGLPCYLGAVTVCQTLFNKYFPHYSVLDESTRITQEMSTYWSVPNANGTVKAVSELCYQLAQKCAVCANNNPFDITPIYSPSDTTPIVYNRNKYWADQLISTPT